MIMVDEASRLVCLHFLFEHHPKEQSRNCTGAEAVASWVRHEGAPAAIRLDPEGAFKSWELREWAQERSIEVLLVGSDDPFLDFFGSSRHSDGSESEATASSSECFSKQRPTSRSVEQPVRRPVGFKFSSR